MQKLKEKSPSFVLLSGLIVIGLMATLFSVAISINANENISMRHIGNYFAEFDLDRLSQTDMDTD